MNVLSERRMGKALREFVEKEEKDAIKEFVKWELGKVQSELFKRNAEEDDIQNLLEEKKNKTVVNEEEEDEEIEQVFQLLLIVNLIFPFLIFHLSLFV